MLLLDEVALVVGVVPEADPGGVDVGAVVGPTGATLTALMALGVVVVTAEEAAVEGSVATADWGAEVTATEAAGALGVEGTAVSVVGPASVDVHEPSRTALIDSPTSRPVRRLFIISDPPLSSS